MNKNITPLYNDLMAKYIFGTNKNKRFLAKLLELIFNLEEGTLKNIKVLNSVPLNGKTIKEKNFTTDILAELPNKEIVNIEFYKEYYKQINIIKENKVHKTNNIINKYILINDKDYHDKILPEIFQIYTINLDEKINVRYNESELTRWIRFIGSENEEEIKEIIKEEKMLKEVYEEMRLFKKKKWWEEYHYDKEKYFRATLEDAKEIAQEEGKEKGIAEGKIKGKIEGLKEGKIEGKREGKIEGLKEGKKEGTIEIAKNMLKDNVSIETISKYTNLSHQEIKNIMEKEA